MCISKITSQFLWDMKLDRKFTDWQGKEWTYRKWNEYCEQKPSDEEVQEYFDTLEEFHNEMLEYSKYVFSF